MLPLYSFAVQSTRNTVPVPRHWCFKRKYLQGKRGIEKPPFNLPFFIKDTGVMEMRQALQEKEDEKTLKAKTRERVRGGSEGGVSVSREDVCMHVFVRKHLSM